MIRRVVVFAAAVLVAGAAMGAEPRISFHRVVPAPQPVGGADDIAIVFAIGDSDRIAKFLDVLLDETNRSGFLRVYDATSARPRVAVDANLRVRRFACRTDERRGEGGTYDADGKRVRRPQRWVDAICTARIEVVNAATGAMLCSFSVKGEGTSPRVAQISREETAIALDQAARYSAVAAAEQITPRRLRETIQLFDEVPRFDDAMSMIDSERLDDARRIWERALSRNAASARLHHNLAAVCEAAGDLEAAEKYYAEAQRLGTGEPRHRIEWQMFRRRNGIR